MIKPSLQENKKLLVIVLFSLLLILVFATLFLLSQIQNPTPQQKNNNITPTTTLTPRLPLTSPLQKTVIKKTTDQEVVENNEIINITRLPDGSTQYDLQSPIIIRPNTIITKNGFVVFERVLTPEIPSESGYKTLSSVQLSHGNPEKIITGSNFYGWHIEYRIYATNGFTLIGNPNTDEVYEIHFYEPMSVEEYINLYGNDINTNLSPHNETY